MTGLNDAARSSYSAAPIQQSAREVCFACNYGILRIEERRDGRVVRYLHEFPEPGGMMECAALP